MKIHATITSVTLSGDSLIVEASGPQESVSDFYEPSVIRFTVLTARADRAELERTGARIPVAHHLDNTGMGCRNVGPATLVHDLLHHDCCYVCNDAGEAATTTTENAR